MQSDGHHITICKASVADAAAVWEIQQLAFRQQALLYNDFKLPPLVQTLDELKRDFASHVFLKATGDNKIIGSVRGKTEGTTCRISRLIVHPGYQNRGIGKMLMRAIESYFADALRFELFTGHRSEKNLALYESLGYREFARKPQGDTVMLVCLEKNKA